MLTAFAYAGLAVAGFAVVAEPSGLEVTLDNPRVISASVLESNSVRYELDGIDAPDFLQGCRDGNQVFYRCGYEAWLFVHRLVEGQPVVCRLGREGAVRSVRARCRIDGRDLADLVVRQGHAVAVPGGPDYSPAESEARQARRGLWSGTFMVPAEWRQRQRQPVFVPHREE